MTTRVVITILCDVRRTAGCHQDYAAEGDNVPAAEERVRREAQSAGWRKELPPRGTVGQADDVCPACAASRAG